MSVQLIAGLGNPGADYATTRHNVGWMAVDALASRLSAKWRKERKFRAEVAKLSYAGTTLWLAKPLTFMNLSGEAIGALMRYQKLTEANVAVVYDEINLPPGRIKLSAKGSAGGHNGVSSVMAHCGSGFIRVKFGIGGKPHPEADLKDWVLGRMSGDELKLAADTAERCADALEMLIRDGLERTANQFNQKPQAAESKISSSQHEPDSNRSPQLPGDLHPRHAGAD